MISGLRTCSYYTSWRITSCLGNVRNFVDKTQNYDEIFLKGMVFHGFHGVLPEEQKLGQKFIVDATLFCCIKRAGQTDDLYDTIDYAAVYTDIKSVFEGQPCQLQEKVVSVIAGKLLDNYPSIQGVQLQMQKPHVALVGVVDGVGVKITRWREKL